MIFYSGSAESFGFYEFNDSKEDGEGAQADEPVGGGMFFLGVAWGAFVSERGEFLEWMRGGGALAGWPRWL